MGQIHDKFLSNYIDSPKSIYPFCYLETAIWDVNTSRDKLNNPDAPTKAEMEESVGSLTQAFVDLIEDEENLKEIVELIIRFFFEDSDQENLRIQFLEE